MIKAEDAQFHAADADKPNWAETNYFGFYSAEANINVGVYALFRPNLGIVNSTISINSRRAMTPWHADYNDLQSHLPIPEPRNLLDYRRLIFSNYRIWSINRLSGRSCCPSSIGASGEQNPAKL